MSTTIVEASRSYHQFKPHLFPHDSVEALTGLIGEHYARVVVISVCVHIKRHAEVHGTELVISCLNQGDICFFTVRQQFSLSLEWVLIFLEVPAI